MKLSMGFQTSRKMVLNLLGGFAIQKTYFYEKRYQRGQKLNFETIADVRTSKPQKRFVKGPCGSAKMTKIDYEILYMLDEGICRSTIGKFKLSKY